MFILPAEWLQRPLIFDQFVKKKLGILIYHFVHFLKTGKSFGPTGINTELNYLDNMKIVNFKAVKTNV